MSIFKKSASENLIPSKRSFQRSFQSGPFVSPFVSLTSQGLGDLAVVNFGIIDPVRLSSLSRFPFVSQAFSTSLLPSSDKTSRERMPVYTTLDRLDPQIHTNPTIILHHHVMLCHATTTTYTSCLAVKVLDGLEQTNVVLQESTKFRSQP